MPDDEKEVKGFRHSHALHRRNQGGGPFVPLGCTASPDNLARDSRQHSLSQPGESCKILMQYGRPELRGGPFYLSYPYLNYFFSFMANSLKIFASSQGIFLFPPIFRYFSCPIPTAQTTSPAFANFTASANAFFLSGTVI